MSDKVVIQRGFNTLFFEFLSDIQGVYPDNNEIAYAVEAFGTVKRMNPAIIIRAWYNYAYKPYANYIDGGDLNFFLNKNYEEDIENTSNKDEFLKMIDKVREPLRNLDDVNREHIKNYLHKLNKLAQLWGEIA